MTEFESSQNCTSFGTSVIGELKNLQCLAVLTSHCRGNLMRATMEYYLGLITNDLTMPLRKTKLFAYVISCKSKTNQAAKKNIKDLFS